MNGRRYSGYGLARWLALGFMCWSVADFVRADVVQQVAQAPEVGVKLTELRDGRLCYTLYTGREISLPIEQITYLQVTGWTPFNEAEKQQRDQHHREAVRWYQRAADRPFRRIGSRSMKKDSAGDSMDYELLARCRLLHSLDLLGQFDLAVEQYLLIVERMPAGLESLRPTNIPQLGSAPHSKALTMTDEAIRKHGQDSVAQSLAKWVISWSGRPPEKTPEKPPLQEKSPPSLPTPKFVGMDTLLEQGRFDEVIAGSQTALEKGEGSELASAFYWRGRAWCGKALSETGQQSEEDLRRAGLAFMRVAILYPEDERAAECLFRAAEIARRTEYNTQADRLLTELLANYPKAQPWCLQAKQILAAARISNSAPAP